VSADLARIAERVERARDVLTDVEYLTWAMAAAGASQRAIAEHRRVSRSTVRDCLERIERKLDEAEGAV
jgi:DNA-binding CsgD family transcriptional regulator